MRRRIKRGTRRNGKDSRTCESDRSMVVCAAIFRPNWCQTEQNALFGPFRDRVQPFNYNYRIKKKLKLGELQRCGIKKWKMRAMSNCSACGNMLKRFWSGWRVHKKARVEPWPQTPTAIEWQWKMARKTRCQIAFDNADISIKATPPQTFITAHSVAVKIYHSMYFGISFCRIADHLIILIF